MGPRDEAGVEGLPFRLLIVVVVVGLTVPPVLGGLATLDRHGVVGRIEAAVDRLFVAARQVYAAGVGADRVPLDLRSGTVTTVLYVTLGDVLDGPLAATVRYRLGDGPERVLAGAVPLVGPDGADLRLGPGRHLVHVEAVPAANVPGLVVLVRVVP